MIATPQPPEAPQVKGGNATLKLYGVAHFQNMGKLSAAKRKQLMGINERPVLTQEEIKTEVQKLVRFVKENQAQRAACKEANE